MKITWIRFLRIHLIGILLILPQSFASATVQPPEQQLVDTSHLVVIATIENVTVPENQGGEGKGLISIRIEKVIKGEYAKDTLLFAHFFGGQGDGDMSKERWEKHWNDLKDRQVPLKFYLFNASQDQRYKNTGIEGWILSDGWFGYEVINDLDK